MTDFWLLACDFLLSSVSFQSTSSTHGPKSPSTFISGTTNASMWRKNLVECSKWNSQCLSTETFSSCHCSSTTYCLSFLWFLLETALENLLSPTPRGFADVCQQWFFSPLFSVFYHLILWLKAIKVGGFFVWLFFVKQAHRILLKAFA